MGGNTVHPGQKSADHHHGEADSGIYVVSGHPRFVFLVDDQEEHIDAAPGDFVYVPAWVPHREENPSDDEDAVVVLARSTPDMTPSDIAYYIPRQAIGLTSLISRRTSGGGLAGLAPASVTKGPWLYPYPRPTGLENHSGACPTSGRGRHR